MSSLRQIEANRRNSLRSTGPRTPEGKAVSRCNALKSGINAKLQVIPGEDPAELQTMADGYTGEWAPQTYLERFLVDPLVRADWLLQRLSRLEAELWTHNIEAARGLTFSKLDENSPIGDVYRRACDAFTRLQRRIDSTERSYYRALTQLQRLRQGLDSGEGPGPELSPAPFQDAPSAPSAPPPENPASANCANEANLPPEASCFRKNPIGFVAESSDRRPAPPSGLMPHPSTVDGLLGKFAEEPAIVLFHRPIRTVSQCSAEPGSGITPGF